MAFELRRTILVIHSEPDIGQMTAEGLEDDFIQVFSVPTVADGLAFLSRQTADVVLLALEAAVGDGREQVQDITQICGGAGIVLITGGHGFDRVYPLITAGATDFMAGDVTSDYLTWKIRQALRQQDLDRLAQAQARLHERGEREATLIGVDGGLADSQYLVDFASRNDVPVLITGEPGTGKQHTARTIHYLGRNRSAAFVTLDLVAQEMERLETDLFGWERGAVEGLFTAGRGLIELVEGGTLLLQEVGALPLDLQKRLVEVLDTGQMQRMGGGPHRLVDFRLVATSNLDLERLAAEGLFLEDLYQRLNVVRLHLPPLRDRRLDIPLLCAHFLRIMAPGYDLKLPETEIRYLTGYHWPGNIKELRNVLERSVILRKGTFLEPSQFLVGGGPRREPALDSTVMDDAMLPTLEEVEKRHIRFALKRLGGNQTRVAKALGISRSTLNRKIRQYGL
jgi:two-component system NtrC family response regulator